MLQRNDVEHLGLLARIALSEEEKDEFTSELDSVLSYVSEISKVTTDADAVPLVGELRNVMREDDALNPGGEFTEEILKNAPATEDGYVKVKQIF
ncbi:MAG: hypothetical protein A2494_02355 [Candidatus Lloydbacteria bacterium RIFOXYC12_FULL_46_25]|uniref:Aspartyl/glutamyl-tRNA(Asn/Gln) amidotransferase subunit C n=1 Tax=Candidatus Lloydbacteria bacterium RIFOXYC12_FULL_46_25 TaxID=1798670 RepID=A0A1G2E058_9BACT|nr:MAG: hypothetical protein A2494_02355 [Candidatus Lloydbacteria bacterium RIFOXYC12_FULL_46_25]